MVHIVGQHQREETIFWEMLWHETFPEPLVSIQARFTQAISQEGNFLVQGRDISGRFTFPVDADDVICISVKKAAFSALYTYEVHRQTKMM